MALYNKIALVTGAAIGIGKAITEILLKNGAKVVFFLLVKNLLKKFLCLHELKKMFLSSILKNR